MPDWGTLDPMDEGPGDSPAEFSWGKLTGSADGADTASAGAMALDWGTLDVPEGNGAAGAQAPSSATPGPPPVDRSAPPAEATASLLADGDVLWARIGRSGVSLGSGQTLFVEGEVPADQSGWCRVEVLDAPRLLVRILPVAWEVPRSGVGDEPVALYRPGPITDGGTVGRSEPFPVGQGPDLRLMMEARVSAAEASAERRGRAAENKARQQAETAARAAEDKIRQAAARASEQVNAASRELDLRLAEGSTATRLAQEQAERLRGLVRICAVIAGIGWLIALIYLLK